MRSYILDSLSDNRRVVVVPAILGNRDKISNKAFDNEAVTESTRYSKTGNAGAFPAFLP